MSHSLSWTTGFYKKKKSPAIQNPRNWLIMGAKGQIYVFGFDFFESNFAGCGGLSHVTVGHEQSPWRHQNHSREPHEVDDGAVVDVRDPPLHRGNIFLRSLLSAFSWWRKKPWMNSLFFASWDIKISWKFNVNNILEKHFELWNVCFLQPKNFFRLHFYVWINFFYFWIKTLKKYNFLKLRQVKNWHNNNTGLNWE